MAGFKFSIRIAAVALLVSGFAASCAQIMGDIDVIGVEQSKVEPLGPGPKPKICEEGVTQCMGRLLQLCTDEGTAWATLEVCATPALCESSGISTVSDCIDPVCLVEEMSCSKEGVLRLCNLDQNGWQELEACETPGHCNAANRQCLPSPCEPGERRCNAGALERCQDDQKDWLSLDTCETNLLCEATLEAAELLASTGGITGAAQREVVPEGAANAVLDVSECLNPACLPGEVKCDGSRLERCNEGRTAFELSEECATTVLCQATLTYVGLGGRPRCRQPICVTGEHSCTPEAGVLQVCTEGRDSYVTTEACIGPEFCNAPAADVPGGQGCLDAPCESGEMQCNGPQVQRCRTNRTGFDAVGAPCETRGLCNDDDNRRAFCEPAVCQRGPLSSTEFLCQGTSLLRCNDQHTAYEPFATCATPELCQAGFGFEGCRPPACAANTFQCNGDFLAVCNPERTAFVNTERCAPGECNAGAGRCADPCLEGTARCNAQGQLEECRNRLVGREITARCLSQQLCDATARTCKQPVCTADGQRRCRVSGQNSILEVCTAGRSTFTALDTCGPGEFCDVNNDRCDVCDQNSTSTCEGNNTLVTCAANGQSENPVPCPQGCQTQNGADRCRTCAVGSASCDGTQLVVCQAGAAGEIFRREFCDSGALCQQALAECNSGLNGQACQCKPGVCLPNAVTCQGRQPVRCRADRTGFEPVGAFCTNTLCDPDTGTCDLCNVGDTRCAANGTMEGCSIDGSRFETILRAGNARCLSPDGPEQRCAGGGTPSTTTCANGICLDGVGCVECDANNFDSACIQTPAGPARTECVGGDESSVPCQNQSGACFVASCNANGCNTQPRCTGALPFCVANGTCVQCLADGDCGAGLICNANRCERRCQANECRNGQLQVCQANGRLAEETACPFPAQCQSATACRGCNATDCPTDACSVRSCTATGCSAPTSKCTGTLSVCLPPSGRCVQCDDDTECDNGICVNNSCAPACAEAQTQCRAGGREQCNNGRFVSVPCGAGTPVCTGTGQCVQCNGNVGCNRAGGETCVNNTCVAPPPPECTGTDARCGAGGREQCVNGNFQSSACGNGVPVCIGTGQCVQCSGNLGCNGAAGETCVNNTCVAPPPPPPPPPECTGDDARCGAAGRERCDNGSFASDPCGAEVPICIGNGQCVACNGAVGCGLLQTCVDNACQPLITIPVEIPPALPLP